MSKIQVDASAFQNFFIMILYWHFDFHHSLINHRDAACILSNHFKRTCKVKKVKYQAVHFVLHGPTSKTNKSSFKSSHSPVRSAMLDTRKSAGNHIRTMAFSFLPCPSTWPLRAFASLKLLPFGMPLTSKYITWKKPQHMTQQTMFDIFVLSYTMSFVGDYFTNHLFIFCSVLPWKTDQ